MNSKTNFQKYGKAVHAYLFKVERSEVPEVDLISNKRFAFMVTVGIAMIAWRVFLN